MSADWRCRRCKYWSRFGLLHQPIAHGVVGVVEELAGGVVGGRKAVEGIVGVVDGHVGLDRPVRDGYLILGAARDGARRRLATLELRPGQRGREYVYSEEVNATSSSESPSKTKIMPSSSAAET
jgi:hypothetical protein